MTDNKKSFSTVADVLAKFDLDKKDKISSDKSSLPDRFAEDKYISREFQKYGYELARQLGDLKNKSLYIKLAKTTPRAYLELAKNFVKDARNVKSPGKLFMWKLGEIKKTKKPEAK